MNTLVLGIFSVVVGLLVAFLFWRLSRWLSIVLGFQNIKSPISIANKVVRELKLLPSDLVVELGAGDGKMTEILCDRFGCRGVGYEMSPHLVKRSNERVQGKKITFTQGNLFEADISEAKLVYCYLLPEMFDRLEQKFLAEMKQGSFVVSYSFPMPSLTIYKEIKRSEGDFPIYIYRI